MAEAQQATSVLNTEQYVQDILSSIEREREREIIARRFGLFDRKETLEQIGELLGITRERVRQLEKSVIARLKATAEQGGLPHIEEVQTAFVSQLETMGGAARISNLSARLTAENSRTDQSRIAFLALLCPDVAVIEDNDTYYYALGTISRRDEKTMKSVIAKLTEAIKKHGEPTEIAHIAKAASIDSPIEAEALASISKQLATLNGKWGLVKWSMVNPKNIRDKIYVILKEHGKHMHFNEIAGAIKQSDFKRKDVTTQAIHNELIKDKRFVLIGRGIYALKEWGYKKGTVADIIAEVLREAGEPLHRDEIVKRVLKSRFVKETTILLNLQGKSQFKRVAKATYALDEE
ncbi:MAG TPA: sigma factor-like helix-turn-helix DNA-binding protein [Candidatus Saccharimonadales bacterium]|jgi:DNA-binding phage protein|nr:sigma factor-like helix-turn-helix DNA-binding protein [Candidatus Saccharimonadales bacterium]